MLLRVAVVTLAALSVTLPAVAQHNHSASHEGNRAELGAVTFANSCTPDVQEDLARAVAMLHSFWYSATEKAFRDVFARDPTCAVANWGVAAILMNNPLAGVGAGRVEAERAQAAIEAGRRAGASTQRERDYIEAVATYYRDWASRPERERQVARAAAFEALAARYPDDDEAQIFSALYIAGTQAQSDQSFAAYRRAASILEPMFAKYPRHPGVAHYLIHAYDAPPLANQGLVAARRYAGIAPDAPHALHMPSHIFTRVGAWQEASATNRRAYQVAVNGNEIGEAYHASDYAVYAELQLGRDATARAAMEDAFKVRVGGIPPAAMQYAMVAMPARYALERGDWAAASRLPPTDGGPAYPVAISVFARALGSARTGDPDAADKDFQALEAKVQALRAAGNVYWATETDVQQRTAAAWIAFARNRTDEALQLMRSAADLEDHNEKHIVTPGRVLPARELLGDMLLEAGQPAQALREYEASQAREPNRFRGYWGAARAAEAAGDRRIASDYYRKLLALAKDADTERPEITRARAFLLQ